MYTLYNEDCLVGLSKVNDGSVDLVVTNPPYCVGKNYGNNSDTRAANEFLEWTRQWIEKIIPKLKVRGSLYIFTSWRYSPEIFCGIKKHLYMINKIIWDRRVPSMGGGIQRFSSVHDTIGLFALDTSKYYFDIDSGRIPYDPKTKRARNRNMFKGRKRLELGCNPKDVWSVARLQAHDAQRVAHPTQKPRAIIERMIKASCPPGRVVLDPFCGSGTTVASLTHNQKAIGFELNTKYYTPAKTRIKYAPS